MPQAKDIVLGVNGEIYNYTDLQDSLEARWADIVCGVSLICAKAWKKFKFGGLELIQNLDILTFKSCFDQYIFNASMK